MSENETTPVGGTDNDGQEPTGSATIHRFFDAAHQVLVASGTFSHVHEAWIEHAKLWDHEPDGLVSVMMNQGLAAAALHLSCRPLDEQVAWTLNVKTPPMNIFLTGDCGRSTVTGRAYVDGVQTADTSRLFVESTRSGNQHRSVIDIEGLDVHEIFEQYYERSEQWPGRFFEIDADRHLAIIGLPDCDTEWLRDLDVDQAVAHLDADLKPLDVRTFWFQCGCHPDRILPVVFQAFGGRPDELFQDDDRVEVTCPRCARRWWITKERFDEYGATQRSDDATPPEPDDDPADAAENDPA